MLVTDRSPRYATDQQPTGERRRLLDRTPTGALVLDVGCWSGYNGTYLRERRGCVVDGVEPNQVMAALAAPSYRAVHGCTIQDALHGPLRDSSDEYDAVLLMDVLEHLVDPEEALRRCAQLAKPDGRLLVSLPNIAHWSVRKSLLAGRWNYESSGILDRTHLRFFTFETATRLVEAAGLQVSWRSAALDRPPIIPLSGRYRALLRPWPGLFASQIMLELRR